MYGGVVGGLIVGGWVLGRHGLFACGGGVDAGLVVCEEERYDLRGRKEDRAFGLSYCVTSRCRSRVPAFLCVFFLGNDSSMAKNTQASLNDNCRVWQMMDVMQFHYDHSCYATLCMLNIDAVKILN
ncbi:uncharacterized protein MYCFIDRAFT_176000 [Pseudocercospora fijiensis CIRAD86]|uniref:Uncharacterized protein n=1 Tax=Pseudocercospora fijiensis (strain CIRAD86) TaxID=383855 RepID=M3AZ38_PSEFD|nr:uncharacterized protein MYCFIDRAFT_176000 [Pseudocercospora fijiensis CIRAD86]EME82453.1 hypothetical protein MYCFIDRAFT_176000 [Pseudocercospora fijiensis CIRAD86]